MKLIMYLNIDNSIIIKILKLDNNSKIFERKKPGLKKARRSPQFSKR